MTTDQPRAGSFAVRQGANALPTLPDRCPKCGTRTWIGALFDGKYLHCGSMGCPWFLTTDDGVEHFR